jgi:hypothetical protein
VSRRHRSTSSVSTFRIIGSIVVLLVGLILAALMLAPPENLRPDSSTIIYGGRPGSSPDTSTPKDDSVQPKVPVKTAFVEPPKQQDPFVTPETHPFALLGQTVDAHSKKALAGVVVRASRRWTAEEESDWKARDAEARQNQDAGALSTLRQEKSTLNDAVQSASDKQGGFEIRLAAGGNYTLEATLAGYLPASQEVTGLSAESPEQKVQMLLSNGAIISGRITETGSGLGAVGLRVSAKRLRGGSGIGPLNTEPALTDENGEFRIGALGTGDYGVSVEVTGTAYQVSAVLPYKETTINTPTQEVTGVDFQVDRAGVVWGHTLTPDGEPIAGAKVFLFAARQSLMSEAFKSLIRQTAPLNTATNKEGYYELMGVPLGEEWRVHADEKNSTPQLSEAFLLTASNDQVNVEMTLFGGSRITGRVIDGSGEGVPEADVLCFPSYSALAAPLESPKAFSDGQTDGDGFFAFEQIPEGDYQVMARKKGYKLPLSGEAVYPDGFNEIAGVQVLLAAVDEGDHEVVGTVLDMRGQPVSDADITLSGMGSESMSPFEREAVSDSDGAFVIEGMELGVYHMTVSKEGYSEERTSRVLLDTPNEIMLQRAVRVAGRVLVREGNQAPPSYAIQARREEAAGLPNFETQGGRAFQNPDGSFEIILPPGDWRIEARAGGYTPAREHVTVLPERPMDGITLMVSESGGRIAGQVTTSDRNSPQGTMVSLHETSGAAGGSGSVMEAAAASQGEGQSMPVGEDGFFSFDDLPEGTYRVTARHQSYAPADSGMMELSRDGNISDIELELGSGGILQGYVLRDGRAVPGAMIIATGGGTPVNTTTDHEGFYELSGLASGVYQVMMTIMDGSTPWIAAAHGAQSVQVEVEDGQVTRYDFGGGEGTRLVGRCSPPPRSIIGGLAVLHYPGPSMVPLGETASLGDLAGQNTAISATGNFEMDNVSMGEWQIDIYYIELGAPGNPFAARFVHSEPLVVEGQEEIPLQIMVQN